MHCARCNAPAEILVCEDCHQKCLTDVITAYIHSVAALSRQVDLNVGKLHVLLDILAKNPALLKEADERLIKFSEAFREMVVKKNLEDNAKQESGEVGNQGG